MSLLQQLYDTKTRNKAQIDYIKTFMPYLQDLNELQSSANDFNLTFWQQTFRDTDSSWEGRAGYVLGGACVRRRGTP